MQAVNINLCDEEDLLELPGIGRALAARICAERDRLGNLTEESLANISHINLSSDLVSLIDFKPYTSAAICARAIYQRDKDIEDLKESLSNRESHWEESTKVTNHLRSQYEDMKRMVRTKEKEIHKLNESLVDTEARLKHTSTVKSVAHTIASAKLTGPPQQHRTEMEAARRLAFSEDHDEMANRSASPKDADLDDRMQAETQELEREVEENRRWRVEMEQRSQQSGPYSANRSQNNWGRNMGQGDSTSPMYLHSRPPLTDHRSSLSQSRPNTTIPDRPNRYRRSDHEEYQDPPYQVQYERREGRGPRQRTPNLPRSLVFNGIASWSAFHTKFTRYADAEGWTDRERLNNMCWCLIDKASDFFALCMERDEDLSYFALVKRFETRFGYKDLPQTAQVEFNIIRQKPTESLEEWAEKVLRTGNLAFKNLPDQFLDEQVIMRFCLGCRNGDAGLYASTSCPRTLEQAIEMIKRYEQNLNAVKGHQTSDSRPARRDVRRVSRESEEEQDCFRVAQVQTRADDRMSRLERRLEGMSASLSKVVEQLNGRSRSPTPPRQGNACFTCGKAGHFQRECPQRSPMKRVHFREGRSNTATQTGTLNPSGSEQQA